MTPPPPRRPPPRQVEVVSSRYITPRLLSVVFGGEALAGFREPQPTAHIKLFLPDHNGRLTLPVAGPDGLIWPDGRPPMRTFTPRRFDPARNELEVQFVLHGQGVAARWAERAGPGDRAAIGGPAPAITVDPVDARWWVGADESALPAVATLIEALPEKTLAEVHLEVEDELDHCPLPDHPGVRVFWHHRHTSGVGQQLLDAAGESAPHPETRVWVACESSAVRRIRGVFVNQHAHPPARLVTRGYWRAGFSDHSDHDHGDD